MKKHKSVLAEGEATGHAHRLVDDVDVVERDDGVRIFSLEKGCDVTHEEHGVVKLPKGDYLADRVVEQDHFAEEARRVAD